MIGPLAAVAVLATTATDGSVHVPLRGTIFLERPGATAAWVLDPNVARASLREGRIEVEGVASGTTHIAIAIGGTIETVIVTVDRPAPRAHSPATGSLPDRVSASLQEAYDHGPLARITSSMRVAGPAFEVAATHLARVDEHAPESERNAIPWASATWRHGIREVTVLDRTVRASPLTVDGTSIRGAHFIGEKLHAHAGWSSPLYYETLLLPAEPESAAGASWRFGDGRTSLTPQLWRFGANGERTGTVASAVVAHGSERDPMSAWAELGWGGVLGAAAGASLRTVHQDAWIEARHRPVGFAGLRIGNVPGTTASAGWSASAGSLDVASAASASSYSFPGDRYRSASASIETRRGLGGGFTAIAGGSAAVTDDGVGDERRLIVPVGLSFEWRSVRVEGRVRRESLGESGANILARYRWSRSHVSAFADWQDEAVVNEVEVDEMPAGAGASFADLRLRGRSTAGLDEVLRSPPAGARVDGVRTVLHRHRVQAGGEIAWTPSFDPAQALSANLRLEVAETSSGDVRTMLTTMRWRRTMSRRIDLEASYSRWQQDDRGQWAARAAVRMALDASRLGARIRGGERIEGRVAFDLDAAGGSLDRAPPAEGIVVRLLEDGRTTLTDEEGAFSFTGLASRPHRIEVVLPDASYRFTTDSSVTLRDGEHASIGLSRTAARVGGTVVDDTGAGLAGVGLSLRSSSGSLVAATTSADGSFAFYAEPGAYTFELLGETLPAGYLLSAPLSRSLRLSASEPAKIYVEIPALRSIAGRAPGSKTVWIEELGRIAETDSEGRFVFRNLPSGTFTLISRAKGRPIRKSVVVPRAPGAVRGIELSRL